MENKILDIPEIPSGIIEAAQKGKLVIFIGAGVSRLLGSPGWQGFAMGYIDYLYNNNFINHREKEYLKDLSARKIISICTKIIKKNEITLPDHRKILNLDKGHNSEKYEIYKILYSCNAIYVTTNYDDYLDKISKKYIPGSYFGDKEDSDASLLVHQNFQDFWINVQQSFLKDYFLLKIGQYYLKVLIDYLKVHKSFEI